MELLDDIKKKYIEIGREIDKLHQEVSYELSAVKKAKEVNCDTIGIASLHGLFRGIATYNENNRMYEIKIYKFSDKLAQHKALIFAKEKGLRLLNVREIHFLIALGYFKESDPSFWSSSSFTDNRMMAWMFNNETNTVGHDSRSACYSVYCVGC